MTQEIVEKLETELQDPEGFESYQEVQKWLSSCYDLQVSYRTVHQWVRYRLQGKLKVPRLQPAYSPEVNPIERLWEYFKEKLKWESFDSLQDLRDSVQEILSQLSTQVISSLTGWQFILEALSVAGI
ncbi:transposase [Lyngbya aestuarii]|uniref:transposase n=1 Tax=Lyngbya aestuarii TaxID=118322 RepID=UPI00403D935B